MAPARLLSAFNEWARREMGQTEKGMETWRQYVTALEQPPVQRVGPQPAVHPAAPPGAPVTPDQQAAAFRAFAGLA